MIAIGLHYAAYLSEVYRAGLEAIPKGQWEASTALNLSTRRTYSRIIIPQAVPACLPGMGNYLVGIFKDTPMLSVIAGRDRIVEQAAAGSAAGTVRSLRAPRARHEEITDGRKRTPEP